MLIKQQQKQQQQQQPQPQQKSPKSLPTKLIFPKNQSLTTFSETTKTKSTTIPKPTITTTNPTMKENAIIRKFKIDKHYKKKHKTSTSTAMASNHIYRHHESTPHTATRKQSSTGTATRSIAVVQKREGSSASINFSSILHQDPKQHTHQRKLLKNFKKHAKNAPQNWNKESYKFDNLMKTLNREESYAEVVPIVNVD